MKNPQTGVFVSSPQESLELLLGHGFPDSLPHPVAEPPPGPLPRIFPPAPRVAWLSPHHIQKSLEEFQNFKASGPDEFSPYILKHLPRMILDYLSRIFEAIYFSSYTPQQWRDSSVIFIPKPGKDDYGLPSSFRPISLMSFSIKCYERLIYWRLLDTSLRNHPLSSQQHAFRKGFSTETATSTLIDSWQRSVYRGGTVLAVSLDIKGVFDHVIYTSARRVMAKHAFDEKIINW